MKRKKIQFAKVQELPETLEADTLYFEKGSTENTFKLTVTTEDGAPIKLEQSKQHWNDGQTPDW